MSGAWGDSWGDYGTDTPLVDNSPRVCGTGGWSGPKPGDPDNNSLLTATPAFGGIDVSWTYPTTNPHAVAYTKLYRGILPDFFGAIYHATVAGNFFYDKSSSDISTQYYYWIQIVSVNGTVGELIGPATAVARPLIAQVIEQLTGEIEAGALSQELKAEIGNISLLGKSITQEVQDRIAANVALGETVAGLQGEMDSAITIVEKEVTERITADEAIVTSLELMASGFNQSVAGLAEEVILKTGDGSALAQKITTLESSVNGSVVTGQVGLKTEVNQLTGVVQGLYTVKFSVNGLIGGFGLSNNGTLVEAGFDVDRFWVGRSSVDPVTGQVTKVKPFIINGSEVFINDGIINKLTFSKLRDESGSFIVEGGKVKASYIDTKGLIIRDALGNPIFGAGTALSVNLISGLGSLATQSSVAYSSVTGTKPPSNADNTASNIAAGIAGQGSLAKLNSVKLGANVQFPDGSTIGVTDLVSRLSKINSNTISTFMDGAAITRAYIGNAAIGSAQIGDLEIGTLKLAGNAVTVPMSSKGGSGGSYGPYTFTETVLTSGYQFLVGGTQLTTIVSVECANNGGATNGRIAARLRLNGGGSVPMLDTAASLVGGYTTLVTVSGSCIAPHDGYWAVEIGLGNNFNQGGPWTSRGVTATSFASKR